MKGMVIAKMVERIINDYFLIINCVVIQIVVIIKELYMLNQKYEKDC